MALNMSLFLGVGMMWPVIETYYSRYFLSQRKSQKDGVHERVVPDTTHLPEAARPFLQRQPARLPRGVSYETKKAGE